MAEKTQEEVLEDLLTHIAEALGLEATVAVTSDDEGLIGTLHGEELGIFIGRHGQTIDAVQHLAQRILFADPTTERRRGAHTARRPRVSQSRSSALRGDG